MKKEKENGTNSLNSIGYILPNINMYTQWLYLGVAYDI
jgi:hypothetical protein